MQPSSPVPPTVRRAFTLVDVLVTLAIIAATAAIVLPMMGSRDEPGALSGVTDLIVSDLELAQTMSISNPSRPVVVKFAPDRGSYWLAFAADPDTPITRSDSGEPYRVVLGQGRAAAARGITLSLDGVALHTIAFNSAGAMADPASAPIIVVQDSRRWNRVDVTTSTGTIRVTAGPAASADSKSK